MHAIRRIVDISLQGIGDQRRFVQDGPVFPEVWSALLEKGGDPVSILLQPFKDLPPGKLSRALHEQGIGRRSHRLVYNNTIVSLEAGMESIVFAMVPLTRWFQRIAAKLDRVADARLLVELAERALAGNLWVDLPLNHSADHPIERDLALIDFLPFVRIVGTVAYFSRFSGRFEVMQARVESTLSHVIRKSDAAVMAYLSTRIRRGWGNLLATLTLDHAAPPPKPCLYAITRDRPVFLSVSETRRTIKADAATRVFAASCRNITWAVLDSGIDARHPAFVQPLPDGTIPMDDQDALARSRVVKTYDLSYLRELLQGDEFDEAPLPNIYGSEGDKQLIREARERADKFLPIDWGLMRALLEVNAEAYERPVNAHGTHVAGILGADWADGPRGPMLGVCPDIRLIDIRVCKADGSSDEFVITAALQFIRHLNAHADLMAVHGVNMSISLEHDVANYACGRTPVCMEAERTMSAGIVVVAAAGNRGYRHIRAADESTFYQYCAVSITAPGNAAAVITVGSTHRREPHNFGVSYFSSRGPTGDGRIKPDLVAPGEKIHGPAPDGAALTLDGTSMAAPHVSGAAALLLARNPELIGQPARVKQVLCDSATDLGRERYFQGHGLVDVLRALQSI